MAVILDEQLNDLNYVENPIPAGFWSRFLAGLLDAIILLPISLILNYGLKAAGFYELGIVLSTIISIAYKPLLEAIYGATYGKMAANINVINRNNEIIGAKEAILRSIVPIIYQVVALISTLVLINESGLVTSISQDLISGNFFTSSISFIAIIGFLYGIYVIVDIISFFTNDNHITIHDRIGGTRVVIK